MPNIPKRTPERDERFFTGLANGHAVARAAAAALYTPASVYRWRAADAEFAANWTLALSMAADLLAEEADRRGRDGVDEPVFQKGREVGTRRRYSDGLLLARLKALLPHKYRDGYVAPAQPVTVTVREFELEREMTRLIKAGRLALGDLEPGPRATLARLLAQTGEMRE
jgi:hypothetical protein